jgi:pSer/pThr/pTyr-binding forkhead associated (FHA) protein
MLHRLARRLHELRLPAEPARARPAEVKPSTVQAVPREGKLVHEATGSEFALTGARVMLGRSAKGHVPDVDLTAVDNDRSLSRRHAAVWREGPTYFVCEETGVANGTFVNGRRIGSGEPTALKDGDKVTFGLVKLVFHLV